MNASSIKKPVTDIIAAVWLVNGIYCKILNFVPRHELIVAGILGEKFSRPITIIIGILEVLMAIWFLSRIKTRLNALAQISIVATMNILEFILVPDLLLWGKWNSAFAFLFIVLVYLNEFKLNKK
jgi:hypothetical protein